MKKGIGCIQRLDKLFKKILSEQYMYRFIALFFVIVFASFIVFLFLFIPQGLSASIADWGNYSMCLGALLTFISVLLIYNTYKDQSKAYQEQLKTSYRMQFDSTFFNMLSVQRQIHSECINYAIKYKDNHGKEHECHNVFAYIKQKIQEHKSDLNDLDSVLETAKARERICNIYADATNFKTREVITGEEAMIISREEYDIMHYFRNLYHLISHVENSLLLDSEKRKYIGIIQAQMSDEELLTMLFNVIHYIVNNGNEGYFAVLDRYKFFENIRPPYEIKRSYFLLSSLFKVTILKHIKILN